MVDGTTAKFDTGEWDEMLSKLSGPMLKSLCRSMAVAGGQVLRDEAKSRAPVDDGILRAAIYLAYREKQSYGNVVVYSVTWNSKKAPHGHLIEFGHWQPYRVLKLPNGRFVTDKTFELQSPRWTPAYPFLRVAGDAAGSRAVQAMMKRGRERFQELMRGGEMNGDT